MPSYHRKFSFVNWLKSKPSNSIYLNPTSPGEIKLIINSLKSKTSCGLDEVPLTLLKSTPDNIIHAFAHIFNQSFTTGIFISAFKKAKIIPVFKKGFSTDVNNYRPISLLPVISKVLEKLMYTRVVSFLNQQKFFSLNQFGFRKKHSTSYHFNGRGYC